MLAFYELTQEIKVGGDDFALTHCTYESFYKEKEEGKREGKGKKIEGEVKGTDSFT